jgi:hypothetical protein
VPLSHRCTIAGSERFPRHCRSLHNIRMMVTDTGNEGVSMASTDPDEWPEQPVRNSCAVTRIFKHGARNLATSLVYGVPARRFS